MEALQPYVSFRDDIALRDYWMQMTEAQIIKMASSRWVTIGSHGQFHNDLSQISRDALREELMASKTFLEQVSGKPITALAFPYGHYSPAVVDEAVKAGYQCLLAAEYMYNDDKTNPVILERLGINPFISVKNQMQAIIKGNYEY